MAPDEPDPAWRDLADNGQPNGDLTPLQEGVALALAAGNTLEQTAQTTGAGVRTITRWMAEIPGMARRVTELRSAMTSQALGRLSIGMSKAADTLTGLLDEEIPPTVRLAAARTILETALKIRESTELSDRISALEEGRHKP
jgi:hypothetical protein